MLDKLIRDAYGDIIPQSRNEDGSFTALANGDTQMIDFRNYALLRDAYGGILPQQYFDIAQLKFVPGVIGGGGGGQDPDVIRGLKINRFYDEMTVGSNQLNDFAIPLQGYYPELPTDIFRNSIKLLTNQYEILPGPGEGEYFARFIMDQLPGTMLSIEIIYLSDGEGNVVR